MQVSVQFHGIQRRFTRTPEIQVPLLESSRLEDVLSYLNTCFPDLPLREGEVLILVNNNLSTLNRVLDPGDKISFLPPIGGG